MENYKVYPISVGNKKVVEIELAVPTLMGLKSCLLISKLIKPTYGGLTYFPLKIETKI